MDEIEQALVKDAAVKKALAALAAVEAEANKIRGAIVTGVQRVDEVEREISRVERQGDTKADVVKLHRNLEAARAAVQEDEFRLRPVQSAATQAGRVVARAKRVVLEGLFEQMRAEAREREAAVFGAIQTLERESAAAEDLERRHTHALVLWRGFNQTAGDNHPADTDLGSFHRKSREVFNAFTKHGRETLRWTHSKHLVT